MGQLGFQVWIALLIEVWIEEEKKRVQLIITRTVDTAAVRECNGMLIINPIADIKTWEELKVVSVKGLLQGDRVSIGISNFSRNPAWILIFLNCRLSCT